MTQPARTNQSTAHPFIQHFADAWRGPSLESLMAPLREDVTLIQPMSRPLVGKPAASKAFRRILAQYPGLSGDVHGGMGEGSLVMIDWTMKVPIGGKVLSIPVIDRFVLADDGTQFQTGKDIVVQRTAYFDPLPILKATMSSPSAWLHQIKALRTT